MKLEAFVRRRFRGAAWIATLAVVAVGSFTIVLAGRAGETVGKEAVEVPGDHVRGRPGGSDVREESERREEWIRRLRVIFGH